MFGRSVMFCFTPSWIYLLSSCLGGTQNKYDYGWIQDSLVLLMLLTLQYSINDKRGNPGGILSKNVVIVSLPHHPPILLFWWLCQKLRPSVKKLHWRAGGGGAGTGTSLEKDCLLHIVTFSIFTYDTSNLYPAVWASCYFIYFLIPIPGNYQFQWSFVLVIF